LFGQTGKGRAVASKDGQFISGYSVRCFAARRDVDRPVTQPIRGKPQIAFHDQPSGVWRSQWGEIKW